MINSAFNEHLISNLFLCICLLLIANPKTINAAPNSNHLPLFNSPYPKNSKFYFFTPFPTTPLLPVAINRQISLFCSQFLCMRTMCDLTSSGVKLHSKLTAVSSKPVGPGMTHQLTCLDRAMAMHTLLLIFYSDRNPFGSFDLDPIRVSLSEVLSSYPAATGRLSKGDAGNWEVKCNDAGVRFLRAKVGVKMDEWLSSASGSYERDLVLWEKMPENPNTWSPFRIQVNEFEGGGVAIGLSCTHLQAHWSSLTLLFKSWVEAHLGKAIDEPIFYSTALHGRAVPNTSTKSTSYYATKAGAAQSPSGKMATATFRFSGSVVKQCLLEIHEKCPDATPFDLLAALFWTRAARLKGSKLHDQTQAYSLSICMDFRRLLQEPIPSTYFGNALHFSLLSLDEKDMVSGGLEHVAGLVHRHMANLEEEEFLSVVDWLESCKEGGKYAPAFRMYGPALTCVTLEHLIVEDESLMYSAATFGNNLKPLHVSCHVGNVEGEGLIVVMPSPEKGLARTVMVTLAEEEMARLYEDEAILSLQPEVFPSGRK